MRFRTFTLAIGFLACLPRPTCADTCQARSGPYSLQLVGEDGRPLPTFCYQDRTYVMGGLGQRYFLRVRNDSGQRIEVVASVDGRDVLDGRPASIAKRGYLIEARGTLTIDGYRLSREAVAAFRFSSVPQSYACQMGDDHDVGVVGLAVFRERQDRPRVRVEPPRSRPREEVGAAPSRRDAGTATEDALSSKPVPAPAAARPPAAAEGKLALAERRPGLGTEFGEEHLSPVHSAPFERESAQPDALLTLRYNDRAGLVTLGIDVDRLLARRDEAWMRETAQPFPAGTSYAEPPPGWRR